MWIYRRAWTNALPTKANLFKRKIVANMLCRICENEAETSRYVLTIFPWSKQSNHASMRCQEFLPLKLRPSKVVQSP
jgi:hypothetical protein